MTNTGLAPIPQPKFDSRIYRLAYPLGGDKYGNLKHGSMVWEKPAIGYSDVARMQFLYNPSTVTATYSLTPDTSVQAGLLFPTAYNQTELRVPLSQSVEWSLLFDRTYELWGQYDNKGKALQDIGPNKNNPAVVGVLADIMQMKQFTGMNISFVTSGLGINNSELVSEFSKSQGIMQPVFSYVYFGDANNLWYYGYISEWDVTITHWTQFMVPMRCVINTTFTMMPLYKSNTPTQTANTDWSLNNLIHTKPQPKDPLIQP